MSSPERKVFLTRVETAPSKRMRNDRGVSYLLMNPDMGTARNLDLHLNELEPDFGPGPAHFHQYAENVYWVLDGSLEVTADGDRFQLGPGDILLIPPGVIHATGNIGKVTCRFIEIYAPPGRDFHLVGSQSTPSK